MKRLCQSAILLILVGIMCCTAAFVLGAETDSLSFSLPSWSQSDTMNPHTLTNPEAITAIELDIDTAELIIQEGSRWALSSNITSNTLTSAVDGHTLTIRQSASRHWWKWRNISPKILLTVPSDTELSAFSCNLDAGTLEVESLTAQSVTLDIDAGTATFDHLEADTLNADCDAASLDITARLRGDSSLDCDAGEIALTLLDGSEIAVLDGEINMGSLSVNGQDYDGMSHSLHQSLHDTNQGGTLTIHCDLGNISLVIPQETLTYFGCGA